MLALSSRKKEMCIKIAICLMMPIGHFLVLEKYAGLPAIGAAAVFLGVYIMVFFRPISPTPVLKWPSFWIGSALVALGGVMWPVLTHLTR